MHKEVTKAVEIFHNIAFKNSEAKKAISESQFKVFLTVLTELLLVRYKKYWYPDEPDRASGYRCIRVNRQSFDPVVVKSLTKAGIPAKKHQQLICNDVTVWVDPGVVSMRIGEDGSIGHEIIDEELYARNMAKRCSSPKHGKQKTTVDSDIDEGIGSRSPSPPDSPTTNGPSSSQLLGNDLTPQRRAPRMSSPPQEYNPYTMSSHVCNATNRRGHAMLRQAMTPPSYHPQQQQQQRTMTPPTSMYSIHHSQPMSRAPPPSNSPSGGVYHQQQQQEQQQQHNIPVSAPTLANTSVFPSARRSVFAEGARMADAKMGAGSYHHHHPMGYHGNQPGSYMDIPVVA